MSERNGGPEQRRKRAFKEIKTYGLMALAEGKSPTADRAPEDTVLTWPTAIIAEATIFMATFAVMLALSMLFDAPLKELANPDIPENPAKAPWYFLGLQELVGYSAFVGGIVIPIIVVFGLALVPYLDREKEGVGIWFSGRRGKLVLIASLIFSLIYITAIVALPIRFGWLRNWFPDIGQIIVILLNPGTLLIAGVVLWSLFIVKWTKSRRMGAIAVFTYFLVGFTILTIVGVYFRGPNWEFYWSPSQWPGIH